MNQEIIEEFANHADFHVGNEHYDKTPEEQQKLWVEMYTKLVIQECMAICDTEKSDYFKNRKAAYYSEDKDVYAEGEAACDSVKFKIKHKFGVDK